MSADSNKKSARTFQCRDVLWSAFEQMAHDLECSIDYLINESMKQYARQRSQDNARPAYVSPSREPSQPGASAAPTHVRPPAPQPAPPVARMQHAAPATPAAPAPSRGPLPPPPPPLGRPPTGPLAGGRTTQPPNARTVPPPLPRAPAMPPVAVATNGFPGSAPQATVLSLYYQGERYTVTKDRFVIGRGKQSSDLTLKDPNVSRQHAMIEFQNGVYFMVDMGSTNGVEYNGQRIARKQITEGDVFRICDHELSFTYR
ncbi:MAG TPA: FHA domain-containing protein [Polyangiaceae bacterium]|jgi:hypothetical protein